VDEYSRFLLLFKSIHFNLNPGPKLAPSRVLKNCPAGIFSEGVRLPRGKNSLTRNIRLFYLIESVSVRARARKQSEFARSRSRSHSFSSGPSWDPRLTSVSRAGNQRPPDYQHFMWGSTGLHRFVSVCIR